MLLFRTVDLDEVELHYVEAPGSGPTLVIIHGLSGSHAEFLSVIPELARDAHVYALDLRGHGLSGRVPGTYRVADYGRDVAAFMQKVVGEPAVVAGHSLGGLVTVWLAVQAPTWVKGAILIDTPLYTIKQPHFAKTQFYPYFRTLRDHLRRHQAAGNSLDNMISYVGQTPLDDQHTMLDTVGPEAVRERASQLHQLDPAVLDPAIETLLLGYDEPDDLLVQMRCPTHLLAAQSGAIDDRDLQRALSKLPHGSYTIFEGTGHDIHLERPEGFVKELKGFLTSWP